MRLTLSGSALSRVELSDAPVVAVRLSESDSTCEVELDGPWFAGPPSRWMGHTVLAVTRWQEAAVRAYDSVAREWNDAAEADLMFVSELEVGATSVILRGFSTSSGRWTEVRLSGDSVGAVLNAEEETVS
ncbi:hypothetical protein [Subtercola sp. YIM 133946]|uniref:hypothetical protein n=1 Tax=Subtercola sp. YIM 133946 TaxID=3118909 RepID=UPI002F93177F